MPPLSNFTENDLLGFNNRLHPYYYLYILYFSLRARCYNKKFAQYKDYGGRGIKMAEQWIDRPKSFALWILNNLGQRPANLTLDRKDNDGDYVPGNLRWATRSMQSYNQRSDANTGERFICLTNRGQYVIRGGRGGVEKTLEAAIKLRDKGSYD